MLLKFKKGTRFFAGAIPVELPHDTSLDVVGAENYDELAVRLAAAGQRIYAEHVDLLKHDEPIMRDGEEVKVSVSYGANGARVETVK